MVNSHHFVGSPEVLVKCQDGGFSVGYSSCDLLTFWCATVCYLCAYIIQKAADRYLESS